MRSEYLFIAGIPEEIQTVLKLPLRYFMGRESMVIAIEMERRSGTLPRDFELNALNEPRIVEVVRGQTGAGIAPVTYVYPQQPRSKTAPSPAIVSPKSLEDIVGSAFRNVPLA